MISGIKPKEEQLKEYNELKINKTKKILIFAVNQSDNENKFETVYSAGKDFDFKTLVEILPNEDPRFVIYDFDYSTDEKPPRKTSKLLLIFWCPTACTINKKFLYASTKDSVRSAFTGIQKDIQASDFSDLDYDSIRKDLL